MKPTSGIRIILPKTTSSVTLVPKNSSLCFSMVLLKGGRTVDTSLTDFELPFAMGERSMYEALRLHPRIIILIGTAARPASKSPSKNHCRGASPFRSSMSTKMPRMTGKDAKSNPKRAAMTGGWKHRVKIFCAVAFRLRRLLDDEDDEDDPEDEEFVFDDNAGDDTMSVLFGLPLFRRVEV